MMIEYFPILVLYEVFDAIMKNITYLGAIECKQIAKELLKLRLNINTD